MAAGGTGFKMLRSAFIKTAGVLADYRGEQRLLSGVVVMLILATGGFLSFQVVLLGFSLLLMRKMFTSSTFILLNRRHQASSETIYYNTRGIKDKKPARNKYGAICPTGSVWI